MAICVVALRPVALDVALLRLAPHSLGA